MEKTYEKLKGMTRPEGTGSGPCACGQPSVYLIWPTIAEFLGLHREAMGAWVCDRCLLVADSKSCGFDVLVRVAPFQYAKAEGLTLKGLKRVVA